MDCDSRSCLLFLETFVHDKLGETQIDVVRFAKPVVISEVRLIPLGVAVQSELPGESRLGATNPARFDAEFFTNNMQKQDAATLCCIGSLPYDDRDRITSTKIDTHVPCTIFLVRGRYGTLSMALFGSVWGDTVGVAPVPPAAPPSQFSLPPPPLHPNPAGARASVAMPPPFTSGVVLQSLPSVVQAVQQQPGVLPTPVMGATFGRHHNGASGVAPLAPGAGGGGSGPSGAGVNVGSRRNLDGGRDAMERGGHQPVQVDDFI